MGGLDYGIALCNCTMPGAYAHITLVNELKTTPTLEDIFGSLTQAITSVLDYFKFCELGAVSPDYPYLAVLDDDAKKWADTMHYYLTGEMIKAGIRQLWDIEGETKRKLLAWLLGYSAHVAMDVTIHPVVELKVGPYQGHETEHRICEMNQDAYIFPRLNLGEIGLSEHLDSGIGKCGSPTDANHLDPEIEQVWRAMLNDVHPAAVYMNQPDINKWHQWFKKMVDEFGEEGHRLIPLARHVAAGIGLTYPALDTIDKQYIENLQVPGRKKNYDEIFDIACTNVKTVWRLVAQGVMAEDTAYLTAIGNWNLDTGKDDKGQLAFWKAAA